MNPSIVLFGFGTVGKSVWQMLNHQCEFKAIAVRHLDAYREKYQNSPFVDVATALTHVPSADVVVEVMGGNDDAWDAVKTGLEQGKRVVTANKALLASRIEDIEAMGDDVDLLYEAAVGGGIPAIKCLLHHVVSKGIQEVSGILNGTSNYILTKMAAEGADYDEALREAQDKGYAEADPTNDVEGFDALYKARILQRIAFGRSAGNEVLLGISNLLPVDFEYAKAMGCTIKLRCSATPTMVTVTPTVMSKAQPLGSVDGVLNAVTIDHKAMGTVTLTGPGAGGDATAHSIVSDVLQPPTRHPPFGSVVPKHDDIPTPFSTTFYLRLGVRDRVGIISEVGAACEALGVSIDAILQNPVPSTFDFSSDILRFVVLLHETDKNTLTDLCEVLRRRDWCVEAPVAMPLMR